MARLNKALKQKIRDLYLVEEMSPSDIRQEIGLSKYSKQVENYIKEEKLSQLKKKMTEKVKEEVKAEVQEENAVPAGAQEDAVLARLAKAGLTPNDANNALRKAYNALEKAGNTNPTEDEVFMSAASFIGSGALIGKTTDSGKSGVAVMTPAAAQAATSQAGNPNETSRHLKNATMKPKDS